MVSTQPPSGFRDFLNRGAARRMQLKKIISETYQSFGFHPLETPALENLEVLMGSGGGEENEKLIFKVLKRGEKLKEALANPSVSENSIADFGMRFDLTLPLSRVVANSRGEIHLPWKVFQMGSVWRAERAQKGRFREFTQCDVDIVGSQSTAAELEVIQAVAHAISASVATAAPLSSAKAPAKTRADGFELRLSDRRILEAMAKRCGLQDSGVESFAIILDKKDKIKIEDLLLELRELLSQNPSSQKEVPDFVRAALEGKFNLRDAAQIHPEAGASLQNLIQQVSAIDLPVTEITFDPSLARGMGYYSGSVFELRHASAGYSLGGGGRYDHLIGRFAKQSLPACGFSIGFDRLLLLLEEKEKSLGPSAKDLPVFFAVMDESLRTKIYEIAHRIRKAGHRIDVFPDAAKLKNQLKFAEDSGYRWVVIAGEEEFKTSKFNLKDFSNRSEKNLSVDEILDHLK